MNLIYICVFLNKDQLELLKLFLFSILLFSNIESFDLVVITSSDFIEDIDKISDMFNIKLNTMITSCKTVEDSMMNRYKIFDYPDIQKYSKILYLDIDIIMQKNLDIIFNLEIEDKIYAVSQPNSKIELPHFGGQLFDFTKIDKNIIGVNGGVLLFKNTNTMQSLFTTILNHRDELASKNINILIMDQCLLNYHGYTKNLLCPDILSNYINLSHPLENPVSPINNCNIIMNHFYDKGRLPKIQRLKYHLMHLLEILKVKQGNNSLEKNIVLKQYKWHTGNLIFDHEGILRTSWGIGRHKLISDYIGVATWAGINHTIIFNKLYNKFVSINNNTAEINSHHHNTILKDSIPDSPQLNKSLVYFCVFHQKGYADLLEYLLKSLKLFSNYDSIDLLVMTSENLSSYIKKISDDLNLKINIKLFDFKSMHEAGCARLHIFQYENIDDYSNILYLDTDIIIQDNLMKLFDFLKEDKLYAKKEYDIRGSGHGGLFFDFNKSDPKTLSLNSGVLLFKNSINIRKIFNTINVHIATLKTKDSLLPECMDQSFIAYNFIKNNMCNLEDISDYIYLAENTLPPESSNVIITHFTAPIGNYGHKLERMKNYFNKLINNKIIKNNFTMVSKERLNSIYDKCNLFKNTNYSFVECGVAKGGCLAIMKSVSGKNNKIFGFDSFDGMPELTKKDFGNENKSDPTEWVGNNLSGGIDNVYKTFNDLNLNLDNVKLIKGFFENSLNIQENIDNIGEIAILRIDADWYESTKICLEKLYSKVIKDGIIIIDDYGHWIGAKTATDEFRKKNNITSPLIQTDSTEFYWIKKDELTELCILGEKYCVDKSPVFGNHTYTPQYHKLFFDMKSNVKLLLEIGIGNIPLMKCLTNENYKPGASLRMWQDYFSKSNIVGCDILEDVLIKENRISSFQVDQSNIESLNSLIKKVKNIEEYADIIIDDGSHHQQHMVTSFKELWKLVKPDGGIYIIEDIHISFIDRISNLNKEFKMTDAECIYIHKGNFTSDNFVAFRKKSNITIFENRKDLLKNYCGLIPSPKILEIGIFKGEFFDYIISNCNVDYIDGVDLFNGISYSGDSDGNNGIFYNIEKSYLDLIEKYKNNEKARFFKSDSSKFLESKEDNTYDIIYIDGDHSYEGFKKDLLLSFKKIKNGGYIMGHDYEMNMLKAKNIYNFGVKKAADEFCNNYNQKILAKGMDGCVSFCIQINK